MRTVDEGDDVRYPLWGKQKWMKCVPVIPQSGLRVRRLPGGEGGHRVKELGLPLGELELPFTIRSLGYTAEQAIDSAKVRQALLGLLIRSTAVNSSQYSQSYCSVSTLQLALPAVDPQTGGLPSTYGNYNQGLLVD